MPLTGSQLIYCISDPDTTKQIMPDILTLSCQMLPLGLSLMMVLSLLSLLRVIILQVKYNGVAVRWHVSLQVMFTYWTSEWIDYWWL